MGLAIRMATSQKLALALFAVLVLSLTANAQNKSDKDNEKLFGPVKSVQSELSELDPENPKQVIQTKPRDIVVYDAKGNEIKRTIYSDFGFLAGTQRNSHDANGNPTEITFFDEKGALMDRRVYTYTNGKLTQVASSDSSGAAGYKEVYSYDDNGRLRESTHVIQNKTVGKTTFKYDQKGNIAEVAFFTPDGTKADAPIGPCTGAHRVTYSYDSASNPIQIVFFDTDEKPQKTWQYTHDSKGQITKEVRDSEWSNTTYTYTYEYDSRGNWIKQFGTSTAQPKTFEDKPHIRKTVISRKITYYQ